MLIVSQNISNHNITFSSAVIYRINLAWINNLQELEALLKKHDKQKIFLDLPVNRIKPPNNKYSLDDIVSILNSYENIKYFAISNVNSANDLEPYNDLIPKNITIVPKIESPDDELMFAIILKSFSDRQIAIDKKLIDFIIKRIDRSYGKISDFIYKIDELSLKKKKPIDFKTIKEILKV